MDSLQELQADTTHPFVQLVRRYKDDDRIGKEIARRQRVAGEQRSQRGTSETIGKRPWMTAEETRQLADNIIDGRKVPDATEIYNLAVQFGLDRDETTPFIDEGGAYLIHCIRRTEAEAKPRARLYEFPSGESFGDALRAILRTRRVTHRGDAILVEGEQGYDRLHSRRGRANRLRVGDAVFDSFVTEGDKELARKVNSLACKMYRTGINPENVLLIPDELATVVVNLKCTDAEGTRLWVAYNNTVAEIAFIRHPAIRDMLIVQTLRAMNSGDYDQPEMGGAYTALHDMLMIRGLSLTDSEIHDDWNRLKSTRIGRQERAANLDRLIVAADLQSFVGMERFKDAVLAEDVKKADHLSSGGSKALLTGELVDKVCRRRETRGEVPGRGA